MASGPPWSSSGLPRSSGLIVPAAFLSPLQVLNLQGLLSRLLALGAAWIFFRWFRLIRLVPQRGRKFRVRGSGGCFTGHGFCLHWLMLITQDVIPQASCRKLRKFRVPG